MGRALLVIGLVQMWGTLRRATGPRAQPGATRRSEDDYGSARAAFTLAHAYVCQDDYEQAGRCWTRRG